MPGIHQRSTIVLDNRPVSAWRPGSGTEYSVQPAERAGGPPASIDERIQSAITRRISASPEGDYLDLLSDYAPVRSHAWPGGPFTWRDDNWAAGLDWTGVGSFRGDGGWWFLGALLSPRHFLIAAHAIDAGIFESAVHFILADGTVHDAVVAATASLADPTFPDHAIAYLTADVPAGVSSYKVLPADYGDRLTYDPADLEGISGLICGDIDGLYGKPVIFTDQERKAKIATIVRVKSTEYSYWPYTAGVTWQSGRYPDRVAYYERQEMGDSSSPHFLLVDGELILLGPTYTITSFGWISDVQTIAALNAAMLALDTAATGYQLTVATLTPNP